MTVVFLYATAPDAGKAQTIADALVDRRLAACVNILAPMTAVYRWKGAIETANETPFIVKTTRTAADSARDLILELHPYETPAVAAIDIAEEGSNPAFLAWVGAEVLP